MRVLLAVALAVCLPLAGGERPAAAQVWKLKKGKPAAAAAKPAAKPKAKPTRTARPTAKKKRGRPTQRQQVTLVPDEDEPSDARDAPREDDEPIVIQIEEIE